MPAQAIEVEHYRSSGGGNAQRLKHPAFGTITVSRGSGKMSLFGSDFKHNNGVRIAINHAELDRHLSRDWVHQRQQVTELYMSEAQWATFVSSFGVGGGTPVTLTWTQRDGRLPDIIPLPSIDHRMEEASDDVDELVSVLAELERTANDTKARVAVRELAARAHRLATSTAEFRKKSMRRQMETMVETAKVEVHAYITKAVNRMGLAALKDKHPLALEDNREMSDSSSG